MTVTQAPTPGPLDSESVKLLVKGDLLRCINPHTIAVKEGEIRTFDSRTHNEPGSGNDIVLTDSRLGTWSGVFAFIGRPDADGWMPWFGGENPVPGRAVDATLGMGTFTNCTSDAVGPFWSDTGRFRLAPTAPVEASGSERTPGQVAYEGWAQGLTGCEWAKQTATQKRAWEASAKAVIDAAPVPAQDDDKLRIAVEALEKAVWSLGSFGQLAADEEGGNTENLDDEVVVRMTFPDPEYGGENTLLGEIFVRAFRKAKAATDECREALVALKAEGK